MALSHRLLLASCVLTMSAGPAFAQTDEKLSTAEATRQGVEFFEKKIRPVLARHCYKCHAADSKEVKGELLLDTRSGTRKGGASGHGVVPGNLKESLIINALRYEDFEMPPKEPLPEHVIADFEKWVEMGAPDPRKGKVALTRSIDMKKARSFWAFQPADAGAPPKVKDQRWVRNEIDRFILARLENEGVKPVADADPRTLVRRIYFDLIGLPPTPKQVAEFLADPSPAGVERLIDRLLESPQFGERWGRHWLDVVRYGESTGMERNFTFPYAWRYRDYVIRSFNEDKPFDRFILEQVAGDLLPHKNSEQRAQQLIATGMLAMGPKSLNEPNAQKFTMDVVDEQIDVTTRAFVGLTASCARCHDHKFDPIPTREYYALAGVFCSTETLFGTGGGRGNRRAGKLLGIGPDGERPVASTGGGGKNTQNKKLANQIKAAQRRVNQLTNQAKKNPAAAAKLKTADAQLRRLKAQQRRQKAAKVEAAPASAKMLVAMAVQDSTSISDTQIRVRGEANDRGDTVPRGFLSILSPEGAGETKLKGSGRLEYAQWLARPENPLTARVAVNRIWQHLFGRGIVRTVNNFGENGERPTHPELLDHMATKFVQEGWSVKRVIRDIMTSRVYQLSNQANAKAQKVDESNTLLWRANQRRLEAEAIRDAMLMASGQIDLEPGRGSIVEKIGNGDIGRTIRNDRFATDETKRSVYLPIVRGVVPEFLRVFDFPDPSMVFGEREVTTVPSQALFMMNSPIVLEQSKQFAKRILDHQDWDDVQQIRFAYACALSREPSPDEIEGAQAFLRAANDSSGEDKGAVDPAWAGFCQALFASSEFRYLN